MISKSSLSLIIGRSGSGKSRFCLEEVRKKLKDNPRGKPLIYLVPEQVAFQFEYALASTPDLGGIIRAQVLSFRRLAWKVMQEIGGAPSLYIDDTGKSMLIRKVLEKHKGDLTALKAAGDKAGTVGKMVSFYNELKRSKVPVKLFKDYSQSDHKLKDLSFVYQKLEEEMDGLYQDSEDYLNHLACHLNRSDYLSAAEIWVDEFYGFTNQEYGVLEKMMGYCSRITVTLCLDRDYSATERIEELDPFYPTALTCQNLKRTAGRAGVSTEIIILKNGTKDCSCKSPELQHMEKELSRPFPKPYQGKACGSLGLFKAANRRSEIEHIARQVIVLVRDKEFRWRDIGVMVPDLEGCKDIISAVFREYDIPYFLDYKRTVLHHPLIEFVRSALEAVCFNWTYDAVFRCIKTEMLLPYESNGQEEEKWREHMWQLENYVLAFGINGVRWLDQNPWDYIEGSSLEEEEAVERTAEEKNTLETINRTRDIVRTPLVRFQKNIAQASPVGDKIRAIQNLLGEVQAAQRMENWSQRALEEGNLEKAREHLQVYKGFIGVLEQMTEIMAEDKLTPAIFIKVLESGFEGMRLGLVPPAMDQVLVGDLERSRPGNIRVTFIPGANEGHIPSRPKEDGIITEQERESLIECGLELAPGSLRRLFDQQFLTYTVLTRASEGLWISYSLADQEGNALSPSPVIGTIKEMFPDCREITETEDTMINEIEQSMSEESSIYEELLQVNTVHPQKTLNSLASQLSQWKKGQNLHPFWWEIYNWFTRNEEWGRQAQQVLPGIYYKNWEGPLSREISRDLYGEPLRASVSRLEKYRSCPFAHFVQYGLKLKERKIYRLEVPDIGRLFHAALLGFARRIEEDGADWGDLFGEECFALAEEEIERLAPRLQKEVLFSTARYRFIINKLKDTLGRTAVILGKHAQRSGFTPVGLELSFGAGGELPPLAFRLSDGFQVEMAGRIDRVDLARGEDGTAYVRIIDYKSGRPELNLSEIYHGLALQLMVYIDVVMTSAQEWLGEEVRPAGILYFYIHAPMVRTTKILNPREIEKKINRSYRMKGRVLADLKAVTLMDKGLCSSGDSDIIPVAVKQKGGFYKNSKIVEDSFFQVLQQHARSKIQEITEHISQGKLDIYPYRMGKKKACSFCRYKAVCQFEPLLEENRFEVLKGWPEEELKHLLLPKGQAPGKEEM